MGKGGRGKEKKENRKQRTEKRGGNNSSNASMTIDSRLLGLHASLDDRCGVQQQRMIGLIPSSRAWIKEFRESQSRCRDAIMPSYIRSNG